MGSEISAHREPQRTTFTTDVSLSQSRFGGKDVHDCNYNPVFSNDNITQNFCETNVTREQRKSTYTLFCDVPWVQADKSSARRIGWEIVEQQQR
jgi:hypothetical protein